MTPSTGEELGPVQRERLHRAERRWAGRTTLFYSALLVYAFVSSFGRPGSWTDPTAGTPWVAALVTVVLAVGGAVMFRQGAQRHFRSPGPDQDLAISGGVRDIARVVRDLSSGRALDDASRPVGRAVLALHTRRMVSTTVILVICAGATLVAVTVPPPPSSSRLPLLAVAVVGAVGSLGVLGWSLLMRRHANAQDL